MKGIILSGGAGTRMRPLTRVTSKQLLPVYNKPMIFYPLGTLLSAGITEILIIVAPDHCGDYMKLLGSGKEFGVKFTYEIQDKPDGIAQAFLLGQTFLEDQESVALILGDNIIEADVSENLKSFQSGAMIFTKRVSDPERFGVVKFNDQNKPIAILEKPTSFVSNQAVIGLYVYDGQVVEAAKSLVPSARGELEITDLNNWYIQKGQLEAIPIEGEWIDAGTFESYQRAFELAFNKYNHGEELGAKIV